MKALQTEMQCIGPTLILFEAGGQSKNNQSIRSTNYKPCTATSGIVLLQT